MLKFAVFARVLPHCVAIVTAVQYRDAIFAIVKTDDS